MNNIDYLDRLIKVYEFTGDADYMKRIERVCDHIEKHELGLAKEGESNE